MLKADALAQFAATSPESLARRIGVGNGAGAGFGALYQQVQGEVADFIQNGAPGSTSAPPALSVEGWLHQSRLSGASVADEAGAASASGVSASTQQAFLSDIAPWAAETGAQLGVAPHLVAAHAALESGWGQKPLRQADGRDTHNLFSLKSGNAWSGDSTDALTTEFENGQAVKQAGRFRSYPDYASAFRDYAHLLKDSPRYQSALNVGGDAHAFAQALARGGYATDPAYADKLARVAEQVKAQASGAAARSAPLQSRD